MRVIVVGYGSIGARHAKILKSMDCQIAVVSRHGTDQYRCYTNLELAIASEKPEYIIIANKTVDHYQTLQKLVDVEFHGKVLMEKPLFDTLINLPTHGFQHVFVGYNLRFHPLIQRLKVEIASQKILTTHAYVGQYLPNWRPSQNYIHSYSVKKCEGGGVLRDLSHEADYCNWLLGGWDRVVALGGHFSSLAGDSEDAVGLLITMKKCPMTMLHLNYFDRQFHREIIVNTEEHTYTVDLVKGNLFVDTELVEHIELDRDYTYLAQHRAILSDQHESLCTLEQGFDVVTMIHGAEQSMREQKWVKK